MKRLVILVGVAGLTGCYKTEYSAELREPGRVEQVSFVPGGTGSGSGLGFSSSGSTVITSTTVTIPDRYAVVFSCMHGKFSLPAEGESAKRMFSRLKQGDSVTIYYREEYRVADGKRELADLDFVDAVARAKEKD